MPARPSRPHHHSVYIVELSKEVLNEPRFRRANQGYRLGFPCVYVGMTGLLPAEYAQYATWRGGVRTLE